MYIIYAHGFAYCSADQNHCVDSDSTVIREAAWKCYKLLATQNNLKEDGGD